MANEIQVKLTATDEASGALQQLINSAALLSQKFDELGEKAGNAVKGKIKPPVDELGNKLGAMAQLPGPIGEAFEKIGVPIESVRSAFESLTKAFGPAKAGAEGLGAAMSSAMGPVLLVVAGVIAALVAIADAGNKAVESFTAWANKVDEIQQVTGATAEFSSELAFMEQHLKLGEGAMASMLQVFERQMGAAQQAVVDFNAKVADAQEAAGAKIAEIESASTANTVKIVGEANSKLADIQSTLATKLADTLSENASRASEYNLKLKDMQASANQSAEDAQAAHEARMASLAQSRADTIDSFNQSSADRREALQNRIQDIEQQKRDATQSAVEKANAAAQSASDRMAAAKTQQDRNNIGAELQTTLAKLDAQAKADQDKLTAQEAKEQAAVDKADARANAQLNKSLDRLAKQQQAETEAYLKQEARDQQRYDKQVLAAQVAFDKQNAAAEITYQKQYAAAATLETKIAMARDVALAVEETKRNTESQKVIDALDKLRAAGPQNVLIDALAKMNIQFDDFNKLPVDEQIKVLFDGLGDVADKSEQTRLKTELFGRGSMALNDVLEYVHDNGWTNINTAATDHGAILDETQIKTAKMAEYAAGDATTKMDSFGKLLGEKVAGAQTKLNTAMDKMWSTYGPEMTGAIDQVAGSVNALFDALTKTADWFTKNHDPIAKTLNDLNNIFALAPWNWGQDLGKILMGQPVFRAGGGVVAADGSYIVGENGPERFTPSQSGMISKNVVNNWNYSASYGSVPGNEPQASFALMKAMVSQ